MMPFHNLMVCLAGIDSDAELIRYSAAVAEKCDAREINFVHVLPSTISGQSDAPSYEKVEARLCDQVNDFFDRPEVKATRTCHVLNGERVDALLEFAASHEMDLIINGHGRSHRGRTARRLAMKAPCSVWVVPEGSQPVFDKILVPVDFSAPSADALTTATDLAARAGASECLALHVYFNEASVTYEGYDAVIRGQEQKSFANFVAPINLHGVDVKPLFEESANVAHAIERVAERQHINLVVMGSRGRSRSAAVLLGSETEQVISESLLPTLAVKHFGARLNLLQVLLDKKFRQRGGTRYS